MNKAHLKLRLCRGACVTRLRVSNASISAQLFDGFDWPDTAQAVQAQARSTRKRLQKIRQLLADGQWDEQQEMMANADNAKLWADLKAGLPPEQSSNEEALLAALNTELHSNSEIEEWEAVPSTAQLPASPKPGHTESIMKSTLRRSSQCLLDLQLHGVQLSFSTFPGDRPTACILDLSADSLDVFDHIKTSTWRMFLTELRVQEGGFARPTNSPMLRLQYAQDRNPVDKAAIESRLKARVSPLRLHADQDAIDFLKRFFAFKPPSDSETASPAPQPAEAFISMFMKSSADSGLSDTESCLHRMRRDFTCQGQAGLQAQTRRLQGSARRPHGRADELLPLRGLRHDPASCHSIRSRPRLFLSLLGRRLISVFD